MSWLSASPDDMGMPFPQGAGLVVRQRDQAEMPKVIGKSDDRKDRFDSTGGILQHQKPKQGDRPMTKL